MRGLEDMSREVVGFNPGAGKNIFFPVKYLFKNTCAAVLLLNGTLLM